MISNLSYGGAERQVIELANGLKPPQFEVYVCTLSNYVPLVTILKDSSRLYRFPKQHRFDVRVVFKVYRLLKALEIDVVHGFLFDAEITSRLAGLLAGTAVVIGSERNSQHSYKTINYLVYKWTKQLMTVCVANSQAGKEYNRRTYRLPECRYEVVYNGVDIDRFKPKDQEEAKRSLEIPADTYVLLMVGSFKRQKNHPYLLRTIKKLTRHRTDFRLLLVGTTIFEGDPDSQSYYENMIKMVSELELESFVSFLGSRDDIELIYNASDVTVLPSEYEGTPNVALESLACGTPVVATDVADNRLVIPHNEVGFIVPLNDEEEFADRIQAILSDPSLRLRFGRNARTWISENFSNLTMVDNMTSVYENAMFKNEMRG